MTESIQEDAQAPTFGTTTDVSVLANSKTYNPPIVAIVGGIQYTTVGHNLPKVCM